MGSDLCPFPRQLLNQIINSLFTFRLQQTRRLDRWECTGHSNIVFFISTTEAVGVLSRSIPFIVVATLNT